MQTVLLVRANTGMLGGIENQVIQMATFLAHSTDVEPIIVTSPGTNNLLATRAKQLGFTVETARLRPHGSLFAAIADLRRLIRKHRPAIVQSHMFRESMVARFSCPFTGSKHVFRVHTYIDCSQIAAHRKLAYHAVDFITQPLVSLYLTISAHVASELRVRSRIRASAMQIVADGVSGSPTLPADANLPPREPIVGMVANIVEGKGHSILIDALALLRNSGMHISAILFGASDSPRHEAELTAKARALEVAELLQFAGWTEDVWAAMSQIDVVVLPSLSEGTPNSLLEAMGRGKLVIASNVGAIPEFIQHRANGWLHEPGDAHALADCIREVFSASPDTIKSIRTSAWVTWHENYQTTSNSEAQFRRLQALCPSLTDRPITE